MVRCAKYYVNYVEVSFYIEKEGIYNEGLVFIC